ncbi:MAG: restriction endonuclease subunit S [Chlorobi bacterium]|nr:restriction endonuclease subunit S [Chlorobiota bacterium]
MKEGWENKTLREVCKIRPPKKEAKDRLSENELVSFVPMKVLGIEQKYFRASENKKLSSVSSSYTYFRDGDVLLAKITPCFENGKLGIAKELTNGIGFGSSEYIVYRTKEILNNEFLYYFLNQEEFRERGERQMTGAVGHKRIPKDFYEDTLIPTPPLSEQQQIVAILDQAFKAIDQAKANIEKNINNAKELFQSKLDAVFLQKGIDWEEKKLGEIASVEYGYTDKSTTEGDFRYVRITDIDNNGKLVTLDKKYIKYSKEAEKFILRDEDLLMARTGATFAKLLIYNDFEPSVFASYLIRINFQEKIENELYWYFSKSRYYWQQANNLSSGAAQPHFNGKALKQVIFSYPKSIVEQQHLINTFEGFLNETQEIEVLYNKKLSNLNELKKAILQKAFAGELTNKSVAV